MKKLALSVVLVAVLVTSVVGGVALASEKGLDYQSGSTEKSETGGWWMKIVHRTEVPQVHGHDKHTDVEREIFLPVGEGYVFAGTLGFAESNYPVVSGGANADEPRESFSMKVPDDFVSFSSVKAIWFSEAAAGNMYWRLTADYAACGEAIGAHDDIPGLGVTATGGANIINCQAPVNPLTLASLALGDIIGIAFYREGTHGSDTLNDTVYFLGLLFTYVGHQ